LDDRHHSGRYDSPMSDDRRGGIALIAGNMALIVTMAMHPTGRDLLVPEWLEHIARIAVIVHAFAIASMPVLFLGALALTRRLTAPDRIAMAALVVYGLALIAGMIAAVASGFIGPAIAREIVRAASPERDTWEALFRLDAVVNRAFAAVLVAGSSLAIATWSVAMLRQRALSRVVGVYGLVVGLAILVVALTGHLRLDVHGFGLVVLAQAVWFVMVGVRMAEHSRPGSVRA
jgi:hypothetical protein